MTPENMEALLSAISGGAKTIALEYAIRLGLWFIFALFVSVAAIAYMRSSHERTDDELLLAYLVLGVATVAAIILFIRALLVLMTPHISAINYLSGVLK